MGAAHCTGDDRKQVASIPRNHCSHACYIMIAEKNCTQRKAKTLKEQVHRQVCATNIKRTQAAGKPKKAMRSKKTCRWELRKSLEHKTLCGKIRQVNGNSFVIFGLYLVCFCLRPCLILKGQGAMPFFFHSSVAGTCLPLLRMFFCAFLFTVQIVGPFRCFNRHMHGSSGRTILLPLPVQSKSFRI